MTSVVHLRIRHPGAYFRKVSDWNVARRSWPERRGSFQAVGACRERIQAINAGLHLLKAGSGILGKEAVIVDRDLAAGK